MAEREIWEIVAERYGMYKKMMSSDGYNLAADLIKDALRGLSRQEIEPVLKAHGLKKPDIFFDNDDFWRGIQEKLKSDE